MSISLEAFRLSDGTWAGHARRSGARSRHLERGIGSIRIEQLKKANLVLFVEEASHNPEILGVPKR